MERPLYLTLNPEGIDPARFARLVAYAPAFQAVAELRHVKALGLEPLPSQIAALGEAWALARRSIAV